MSNVPTTYAIDYVTTTGTIDHLIRLDAPLDQPDLWGPDSALTDGTFPIESGISRLIQPLGAPAGTEIDVSLATLEAIVQANTGLSPLRPRCGVIDMVTNKVIDVIAADPAVARLPGFILASHSDVAIGDTYDPATQMLARASISVPEKDRTVPGFSFRANAVVT